MTCKGHVKRKWNVKEEKYIMLAKMIKPSKNVLILIMIDNNTSHEVEQDFLI